MQTTKKVKDDDNDDDDADDDDDNNGYTVIILCMLYASERLLKLKYRDPGLRNILTSLGRTLGTTPPDNKPRCATTQSLECFRGYTAGGPMSRIPLALIIVAIYHCFGSYTSRRRYHDQKGPDTSGPCM